MNLEYYNTINFAGTRKINFIGDIAGSVVLSAGSSSVFDIPANGYIQHAATTQARRTFTCLRWCWTAIYNDD